ncbi:MAG: ChaN family lipoprotein [Phycisphaerales bacterium]|nr:ChaN family lipoprotein [Phycisphaerales bacterium]
MRTLFTSAGPWAAFLVSAGLFAIGGCASNPKHHTSATPVDVAPASTLPIFDGHSGLAMTWDGAVTAAANADAVLIGEMHGHPQGLAAAADLFDAVLARRPNTAALALEFMTRDEQVAIDDYLSGVTDTAAFEKAINATASSYPSGHKRMFEAARELDRPVIAANAPRRYVRLARSDGFERLQNLTPEQQRLVVAPKAITEGDYKDRFFELMSGMSESHGPTTDDTTEPDDNSEMILGMFRSQNVWDATMADAVARAIDQGNAPVVLVVGQFHVDFDGGIAQRLREQHPGAKVLIISMQPAEGPDFRDDDRNRADIVFNVGPAPE